MVSVFLTVSTLVIFTATNEVAARVKFSVMSVDQSVTLSTGAGGGRVSYVTITHDALELNIQGPHPLLCPPLPTRSNWFIMKHEW